MEFHELFQARYGGYGSPEVSVLSFQKPIIKCFNTIKEKKSCCIA